MNMNADIEMACTKINPRRARRSSKCRIQKGKPTQMVQKPKTTRRLGAAKTGRPVPTPSLLSLDEVVVRKIMSNLCLEDITNLAGTCTSMADICTDYVRLHHQSISWTGGFFEQNGIRLDSPDTVWQFLGKCVKSIKLSHLLYEGELQRKLAVLAKYCPSLESLTLNNVGMDDAVTISDPILRLFSKLKRFELMQCHWAKWCPVNTFFGNDNSVLEELSIIKCFRKSTDGYPLELNGFRGLKKLNVQCCRNVLTNDELSECFQWNKITSLDLRDVNGISLFSDNLIDNVIETLDTLVIDYSVFDFNQLVRLKNLKSLTIYCGEDTNIDGLLQKFSVNNGVKELFFTRIIISQATINALSVFTHLNSLRLDRCQNTVTSRLFKSISHFPDLEHFLYSYNEYTDLDVVRVVKAAPKLKRLDLLGGSDLRLETYFKIEEIVNSDWVHPRLEIIPPSFVRSQLLENIESTRRNICIRNDICELYL